MEKRKKINNARCNAISKIYLVLIEIDNNAILVGNPNPKFSGAYSCISPRIRVNGDQVDLPIYVV